MAKYKVAFNKLEKSGQSYYERSFSLESLELLLVVSANVKVKRTKTKSGCIVFSIPAGVGGEYYNVVIAKNIPLWILKKFAPEKEWK